MTFESIPLIIFIALPGFISWFIFCWGTTNRKTGEFQLIAASLIMSVFILFIDYYVILPLYRWIAQIVTTRVISFEVLPSFTDILSKPDNLKSELALVIYPTSILVGFLMIWFYNAKLVKKLFGKVKLDLYSHQDTWYRKFHNAEYIIVHLKTGKKLSGWVTDFTTTGDKETSQLYLAKVQTRNSGKWIKVPAPVEGVYINTDSIEYIEFWRDDSVKKPIDEGDESNNAIPEEIIKKADFFKLGLSFYSISILLIGVKNLWSAYSVVGVIIALLSVPLLVIGWHSKWNNNVRMFANKFIDKHRNRLLLNLPKFLNWYILVLLFTASLIPSIAGLITLKEYLFFIFIYLFGIIWLISTIRLLMLELREVKLEKE